MQARKTFRRIAFALVAAAAAVGIGIAAAPSDATASDSARSCVPTCFKNPITGQITCTYPCP